jgi:hypothetical protein
VSALPAHEPRPAHVPPELALSRRQRCHPASVALLVATVALGFLAVGLAVAFERWRWNLLCARICGPFLPADWPPAWIESFRKAMDWHTPLAVAAVAALGLVVLWTGRHAGRAAAPL